MFPSSTHRKFWIFKTEEDVVQCRQDANDRYVERQKVVASIQKIDDYLTSEDSDLVNNRDKKI